jgi:hypothetical protein
MSLINDALRRASDASKAAGEALPPPLTPPPLPEVETDAPSEEPIPIEDDMLVPPLIPQEEAPKSSSKAPLIVIAIVVFGMAGAAGFYFWKKTHRFSGSRFAASMEKQLARMDAAMALAHSNAITTNAISPSTGVAASTSNVAKAATVTAAPTPAPAPVVQAKPLTPAVVANSTPAKFPPLRLQSIFYRPSNPSVMINGKLLCISDEIQGVLVADIQPSSVTLVLSGYTNVLTLR